MKVAFDLDGTLDKPALADLARVLIAAGHQVHIITGIFDEAGDWQDEDSKYAKLNRIGIPFVIYDPMWHPTLPHAHVHVLHAVDPSYGRDYRLADLGLRKGALCEQLGIEMIFDDSETYCKMIPAMAGNTVVLRVM